MNHRSPKRGSINTFGETSKREQAREAKAVMNHRSPKRGPVNIFWDDF